MALCSATTKRQGRSCIFWCGIRGTAPAHMAPIAFSPQDPHTLYAATQYVLKSKDGGLSWQEASPDLTAKDERRERESQSRRQRCVITTCLSRR